MDFETKRLRLYVSKMMEMNGRFARETTTTVLDGVKVKGPDFTISHSHFPKLISTFCPARYHQTTTWRLETKQSKVINVSLTTKPKILSNRSKKQPAYNEYPG